MKSINNEQEIKLAKNKKVITGSTEDWFDEECKKEMELGKRARLKKNREKAGADIDEFTEQ